MIRLLLVNQDGNPITPEELGTIIELREAQDRARNLIRDLERLIDEKTPASKRGTVPYQ